MHILILMHKLVVKTCCLQFPIYFDGAVWDIPFMMLQAASRKCASTGTSVNVVFFWRSFLIPSMRPIRLALCFWLLNGGSSAPPRYSSSTKFFPLVYTRIKTIFLFDWIPNWTIVNILFRYQCYVNHYFKSVVCQIFR